MYAHVGTYTTPLCLARGDCSIVTRRDRFHLWSRMVMTPTPWRSREGERERERVTGSHRSSGPRVQVGKPGSQAARQDEESRIGDTHINLHIFGPHPSLGPRGNPRAPGQPVLGSESFAEWLLTVSFVVLELEISLPSSKSRIEVPIIARRQNLIWNRRGKARCWKICRIRVFNSLDYVSKRARQSDNFVPFSDVPSRGALMIPPESPYFDQIHLIGNSDCARCILHCSEFLRTVCTSFRYSCVRTVNMPLFVNGYRHKREGYSKHAINGTMRCFGPSVDPLFPSRKNSLRWSWTRELYCE